MTLDARFQLDVIIKSAMEPKFRRRAKRVLDGFDFLDPRHTWLWNAVCRLEGEDVLTSAGIGPFLRRVKEDERDDHAKWVKTLLGRGVAAPELSLQQVRNFRRAERIRGAMAKAVDLLDEDVLEDEELDEVSKLLRVGARTDNVDGYHFTDVYEDFDERQAERLRRREDPTLSPRIATKFMSSLDRDLDGGIGPEEVGLIAATTGRGKSSVALAMAIAAARQKFEVVVIATEMNVEQQALRADSNILSISAHAPVDVTQGRLHSFGFTDEEAIPICQHWRRHPELEKRLRLAAVPVRRCTISKVEEILDHAEDDWGKPIRLLIMDSGDHIRPDGRVQDRRNRESEAYWELKSVASERGMAIWSTTHAAKAAVNKVARAEDAGESYDKSRIADIFLSLNATAKQETDGVLNAKLGKNRRGGRTAPFLIRAAWGKTTFVEYSPDPDTDPEEDDDPKEAAT